MTCVTLGRAPYREAVDLVKPSIYSPVGAGSPRCIW